MNRILHLSCVRMRKALTRTTLIANVIEHHKQSLENPLIDDTTLETQNFISKKRVCTIVNENYFSHCVNIFFRFTGAVEKFKITHLEQ